MPINKNAPSQLLDRLLPKTFDLPCNEQGKVDFCYPGIGLLSTRDISHLDAAGLETASRWPFDQLRGINPLQCLWTWTELSEHYLILRKEAVEGNPDALTDIAWLWLNAESSDRSQQANHLLVLAANVGSAEADYSLGDQYLEGRGVQVDLKRAIGYFESAAASLHEGRLKLGMLYEYGHDNFPGFTTDALQAMEWYQEGHVAGDSWATFHMGCLALQYDLPVYDPGLAIHELQNLALRNRSLAAGMASHWLALHYRPKLFMDHYEPLYFFWRDFSVERHDWPASKDLRQEDDELLKLRAPSAGALSMKLVKPSRTDSPSRSIYGS